MKKISTFVAMALLASSLMVFQGCASEQTETVRRTTTTNDTALPATTTTTETTTSNKPDSVLGATAHAVGTVILFPFRLVGDALGLIV